MIRVAGINGNDVVNGEGVSVSLFLQGCHFHCKGCHNPETWSLEGGNAWNPEELIQTILKALTANGIQRNLSILGGEPLDNMEKITFISWLIQIVKNLYPKTKICLWTGYTYNYIKECTINGNTTLQYILDNLDYLIEGPFILEQRDITLKWRGSRNQNIINMKTGEIEND